LMTRYAKNEQGMIGYGSSLGVDFIQYFFYSSEPDFFMQIRYQIYR
jgi:hypothetical protein